MQLTDKLQYLTMIFWPHPAPNPMRNQCTKLCRLIWTPCMQFRENQTSPWPCCKISQIQWTGLLKARGLVNRHRNYCWHSSRELHMFSWGQIMWPKPHTHPWDWFKQENVGMKSRASLDWSSVMQISILIHHTLWRYNRGIMKPLLPISNTLKQQIGDALLTMTLWQSRFLLWHVLTHIWSKTDMDSSISKVEDMHSDILRINKVTI